VAGCLLVVTITSNGFKQVQKDRQFTWSFRTKCAIVDIGLSRLTIYCVVIRLTFLVAPSGASVKRFVSLHYINPIHRTSQTQNKCTQISMPRVGFEPTTPVFERPKAFVIMYI
jgi:hypothetical protein